MKIKRTLTLLLVLAMALALTACSSPYIRKSGFDTKYYNFLNPYYQDSENDLLEQMPAPSQTLDPQEIYDSIAYNERMLYGEYQLYDMDADQKKFAEEAKFVEMDMTDLWGSVWTYNISTLPIRISAGPTEVDIGRYLRDYEWARLTFSDEDGEMERSVYCTYTVSGNTVTFTPVEYLNTLRDENYKTLGYEYTLGTESLTYEFSFDGPRITLSNEDGSITLCAYSFCKDKYPSISGHLASNSQMLGTMDHFHGYINTDLFSQSSSALITHVDEYSFPIKAGIRIYDNGLIDLYWVDRDEDRNETVYSYQLVYIGTDPMVLTDGENIYYYTESYATREMALMGDGMSTEDLIEFDTMSEDEQKQIVEKKANLLSDLSDAFEAAGLNVQINHSTGEIALDSAVLFGVNQSTISPEGQTFLQQFLEVYTSVVFGDEYTDFVSKIMVEGHTDTSGTYELNLALSQARADSVLAYCLSEEAGVDPAYVESLASTLEAVGYSYDKPIYDENGEIDMDASRRVSFRFVINIGG